MPGTVGCSVCANTEGTIDPIPPRNEDTTGYLPLEIKTAIIRHLPCDSSGGSRSPLTSIALVSREFACESRPILFSKTVVVTASRMCQLARLLRSPHRTIPAEVDTLSLSLNSYEWRAYADPHSPWNEIRPFIRGRIRRWLNTVLNELHARHRFIMQLPLLFEREVEWGSVGGAHRGGLTELYLHGSFTSPQSTIEALNHMPNLLVLVVEVVWLHDFIPDEGKLSSRLRLLSVSSRSWPLLAWILDSVDELTELDTFHTVLFDDYHSRNHLPLLERFLRRYGPNLKNLCLWFAEQQTVEGIMRLLNWRYLC
ncbi:hypothetical protein NMY22_g16909 [Coprinellus aureogranulatus]|nr:hypothetical protein NMY22_g16909 [Coprinellus aureogranulatus]